MASSHPAVAGTTRCCPSRHLRFEPARQATTYARQPTEKSDEPNFSDAAAHRNSENVLVNWGNPKLAEIYLGHFERNYRQAKPFELRY
jgi:hypothetical protein